MMNYSPQWEMTCSTGKITAENLQAFGPTLQKGIEPQEIWGYGVNRLIIKDITGSCPITFYAMAYKDNEKKWYIGLRGQCEESSHIKYHIWNINDYIMNIINNLMNEHLQDNGYY